MLQCLELFGIVLVKPQAADNSILEILCVVALECKAQTASSIFVYGGNGIPQTAGGVNNGNSAVTHGVHLAQTARLALGRH